MKKENVIEKGMVAIKGITAMIPVLGGTLTSVWSDMQFKLSESTNGLKNFIFP
jgi:hypothetical protein